MNDNPTFNLKLKAATNKKVEEGIQKQWIIIGVLALIINFAVLKPKLSNWISIAKKNTTYEKNIATLSGTLEELEEKKKELDVEKKEKGQDDEAKEAKIFPVALDTFQIASILEIMALQLENVEIERYSNFSLEGLRFSGAENLGSTIAHKANITVQGDVNSIKEFLDFVKNGDIPEKILKGEQTQLVTPEIMTALRTDNLPIATIERIQINKGRKDDILKATILVQFYSRPS